MYDKLHMIVGHMYNTSTSMYSTEGDKGPASENGAITATSSNISPTYVV